MDNSVGSRMPFFLDIQNIRRNFRDWKPISPQEALRQAPSGQVVVIYSLHGREKATRLAVPFSLQSMPGATLRFYHYVGSGQHSFRMSWPAAVSAPQADLELEPIDISPIREAIAEPSPEGKKEEPENKEKRLFPIEFQLLDASAKPFPPTFFRLTLPDGEVREGESDGEGFIRHLENTQEGEVELALSRTRPESAATAAEAVSGAAATAVPAATAALPLTGPQGKHPIEIRLLDSEGKPLPGTEFRLALPDGDIREGKSDAEGFIRIPENEQSGEMNLVLPALEKQGAG